MSTHADAMTLLLFTFHGAPVGRYELRRGIDKPPTVVLWKGRTFIWHETTPMGWQAYHEEYPLTLADNGLRPAPERLATSAPPTGTPISKQESEP